PGGCGRAAWSFRVRPGSWTPSRRTILSRGLCTDIRLPRDTPADGLGEAREVGRRRLGDRQELVELDDLGGAEGEPRAAVTDVQRDRAFRGKGRATDRAGAAGSDRLAQGREVALVEGQQSVAEAQVERGAAIAAADFAVRGDGENFPPSMVWL